MVQDLCQSLSAKSGPLGTSSARRHEMGEVATCRNTTSLFPVNSRSVYPGVVTHMCLIRIQSMGFTQGMQRICPARDQQGDCQ
jgi:hypothetical protein